MKTFRIEINISEDLTVKELWPDNNGPENPTREDVLALIKQCGGLQIIHDWNLGTDFDIEVVDHEPHS